MTQGRALLASIITFIVAGMVSALGSYLAMKSGGGNGTLVIMALTGFATFVVAATGLSAVGVMLMDRAKMIEVRSLTDAFIYGLLCLPKFIAFAFCLFVLFLVVGLVAALGYFVCRIPGIGPVLLVVAHPLFVFATAILGAAVGWVAVPLFAPSIWEGRSFGEALSVLHAVARSRLIAVVATFILLYLVVGIVGGVVMSALFPAFVSMTGIAASVMGPEISASAESLGSIWMSITAALFSGGGGSDGGGLLIAMTMASLIIFGVAGALIAQVLLMGINLVYLIAVEGLDVAASQAALGKQLDQVKQKAAEAQERARQAADRARATAQAQAAAAAPRAQTSPPTAAALSCPKCRAVVRPGDPFCSECGFKLGA